MSGLDGSEKRDPRITTSRFSWRELVTMFIGIQVIGVGMILILFEYSPGIVLSWQAASSVMGYCALMSLIVSCLTALGRRFVYERPIRQMGVAARKVAQGDFEVRLPSLRKDGKKDFMDVMYDDFNTMVEELRSIEALKDDFVGTVSHEIKTPLATIENYASALGKKNLDAKKQAEYAQAISEAAKRLSILVSNILRLNKLENQGIVPEAGPYDLSEQLRYCVLGFEDIWEEKGIEIEVDVDDVRIVDKDQALLELVWNNLIANAVKFTEPGGTVRVSQRVDSGTVRIDIADTGSGMDDATQRRIFDKFYQGDNSHAQEGNGLGLSLAIRALRLAGGDMAVESEPGKGSMFTVWLDID